MPKKRDKTSDEWYRGQLREQTKYIRQLEKRVKELEKHARSQDEEILESTEDTWPTKLNKCTSEDCGKGIYVEFELLDKVYGTCNVCNHRKRLK